jgi:2-dehydropantoate 2-reductase
VIERTLRFVESLPAEGTTSLQRDLEEGRPSELEAWNGAVVRLAREAAVDVPVHAFIYENLLSRELESRVKDT